ncbi:hypothetical protein [Bacteroides xylanisolvens]|mgnify:CR=1 FL=1|uniref:hypothetical protein n=1 Tax=Bacteroides xylanisolvens TaxID=371601 RepID=UPI00125FD8C5|nr:hypothetical protein [Bacteroides xylanisolvens]KAB6401772.1 hypothetical protein GAZ19_21595 [Bacteroides xylanisolvens]KAB6411942.1 hypothetical protein GAZ18_22335 [Bacteroides xylanisolvens]KAB6420506.1 hypothetical protein GAZ14_22195 [Bacteroides xylanisolvens]KAB6431866.1 hypothetical protein GAZ16_21865 [Bacteroides xylanisolvens]
MKTSLAIVISIELKSFSFYNDALYAFESILSKGLLGFNSDLVEEICIRLVCESPRFAKFFQEQRPKYYEDKTFKYRGSVTPEVRLYKCLTADFVVNFEGYYKLTTKEECLKYLALSFIDFLSNLKYPGKLKKFEKEKLLQAVKDIFIENAIISKYDDA